jgi:regulator of sirC expression with transglutaminase-like and TPR domain
VKTQGVFPARVLDPFNGGAELDRASLVARLLESGQQADDAENALRAIDNRAILSRLLRNLLQVYVRAGEDARALGAVERLLVLDPEAGEEWSIRGVLCSRLGRYEEGQDALDRALERLQDPDARHRVEEERSRLLYWKSRRN